MSSDLWYVTKAHIVLHLPVWFFIEQLARVEELSFNDFQTLGHVEM